MNFGHFSLKKNKELRKSAPSSHGSQIKHKSSLSDSVKKGLENSSREKLVCESTMDNYNKSRSIGVEDERRARGGEASRKKSVKDPPLEVKAVGSQEHVSTKKQPQTARKVDVPSGLENFGNTCYLNAILQCLRSTEVLRTYCVEKRYENSLHTPTKSSGDLFLAFANLITKMHLTSNGTVGSSYIQKFKNAFTKIVPSYSGNLQQDALEFFTYLLDGLHEEIKDRPDSPSQTEQHSSKTLPVLPANRKRRHRLRFGGLKSSASSVQVASTESFNEHQLANAITSKPPSPGSPKSTRKWSLRVILPKYKQKIRPLSTGWIDRQTLEACRAAVTSAEAIADEKSFLKDTFVGHLQTHLQCLQCNRISKRDELFWNLALCVPEVHPADKATTSDSTKPGATASPPAPEPSVTLDDCLRAFTKAEVLDGLDKPTCDHCKMPTKARLQVVISRLPRILVLQFQRFDSTCCKTKKKHLIKFGFEQDMGPYSINCLSDDESTVTTDSTDASLTIYPSDDVTEVGQTPSPEPEIHLSDTNYRLYGVVYHQGGTEKGHYTARCRLTSPPHDGWYLFDDENVSRIADVNDVIQPTAYILFYERILEDEVKPSSQASSPAKVSVKSTSEGVDSSQGAVIRESLV